MPDLPLIAVTTGEPSGIGPEIALSAAWHLRAETRHVLIGDWTQLNALAALINSRIRLKRIFPAETAAVRSAVRENELAVIDCPLAVPVEAGKPVPENADSVLKTLDIATEGCLSGHFDAVATAPVQKSVINASGIPFTGHTEYFAEKTGTPQVVMMLAGNIRPLTSGRPYRMRVALATTHLPLREVSTAITPALLSRTFQIVNDELISKFGLSSPRILVSGLNPHAGENGYLGSEEIDVISPAIHRARQNGLQIEGPFPADTLFLPHQLARADCFLVMYHDQGLPVLKYATFGQGVNITLGLPFIRTSVDHGTALDIAVQGVGKADPGSMITAINLAAEMALHAGN